jgi:hypothetical protein
MLEDGDGLCVRPVMEDVSQEEHARILHGLRREEVVSFGLCQLILARRRS